MQIKNTFIAFEVRALITTLQFPQLLSEKWLVIKVVNKSYSSDAERSLVGVRFPYLFVLLVC